MMLIGLNGYGLGRGLGYSDSDPCSSIPAGDPYRSPGNYCTQPSGNVTEFNADGSVDPDPFANSSAGSSGAQSPDSSGATPSGGQPWWSTALSAIVKGGAQGLTQKPVGPTMPVVPPTPWYKTPLGIGGIIFGGLGLFLVLKK